MTELTAEVLPGPGTVSRFANVGLWLGPDVPEPLALHLLGALDQPLDEIKGTLTTEAPDTLGSLAVISVAGSSVQALVHGRVVVQNARGEAHSGAFTSQILRFDLPMDGLVGIWGTGSSLDNPSGLSQNLREGTVPGGGLVLRAALQPAGEPEPEAEAESESRSVSEPEPEPVPLEAADADRTPPAGSSIQLLNLAEPPPTRAPLPVATEAPPAEPSGQTVPGVMCVNDHFNHPDAFYCRVCGIAMIQLTKVLVDGPRPTLGVVVAANGATYTVDRDYTIGRQPDPGDGDVIVVNDERVSRRHAQLTRSGWDLVVTDLSSANGTYVKNVGWHDWMQVAPGHSVVVEPRGQIGLGSQVMVFESSVRPSKV